LVQLFRKIKFLFVKSDAFLNKKNFLFDFFSVLSLESKYISLLQIYKQHIKKDNFVRNRFLSFFNMISFFLYRIDYYLFKSLSFISLVEVRNFVFKHGIIVNNVKVQTINFFLCKYDLVKLPVIFTSAFENKFIFALKYYFNFISTYSYKKYVNIKKIYYIALYSLVKKATLNGLYLTTLKKKINVIYSSYIFLLDDLFSFFLKQKKSSFVSLYNFDTLNNLKDQYKIEYQFPFFLNMKKKDLFFNTNVRYLGNVSYFLKRTIQKKQSNLFNLTNVANYLDLFFYFFKFKILFYYIRNNKLVVSPNIIIRLVEEQKKLFYYFSILFHINVTQFM